MAIAEMSEEELQRGLSALQASEFLYETNLFPEREFTFKHALTHEVTYGGLVQERKRALHASVIEAIEMQGESRLDEYYEQLVYHAFRGSVWDKAIIYSKRAGEKAFQLSANEEAIALLRNGLAILDNFADATVRDKHELDFQIALGPALMVARGYASPEVETAYRRAQELSHKLGNTSQWFPITWGLWRHCFMRAQLSASRDIAGQYLEMAQQAQDDALILSAHHSLGATMIFQGEPVSGRTQLEKGYSLYDPKKHQELAFQYVMDTGVWCLSYGAWPSWLLGYPDEAREKAHSAIALAEELSHPVSIGSALTYAAWLYAMCRDGQAALKYAEAGIALCREAGFPQIETLAKTFLGWSRTQKGFANEGLEQMREGHQNHVTIGVLLNSALVLPLLAEICGRENQIEEGLEFADQGLAHVHEYGERFWEPENHRIKGELLLQQGKEEEAISHFQGALNIAQDQKAKSLELRAAMSLGRLWQSQGK